MEVVLKNLTKKFPSRDKKNPADVIAVNNFDFTIPDGKLIGLLGPSGCGKSTTLNLISGLEKPTSGQIFFGEDDVTNLPPEKRGIGLVFQNYALYPHLTVRQNILFPLQNLKGKEKLSKDEMNKKALEAAKLVQIEELMERRPSELSGGQQQRVAIARALVKMPRVLLLDEPLSNLDARLRLQTREEIRRIQNETKITTIFVTHDQEEAMSICDQMIVMKAGVVHQIGKPQDIYDNPKNLFVAKFLGTPAINVFEGEIKGNKLFIGEDEVLELESLDSIDSSVVKKVYVGIRPEGFKALETSEDIKKDGEVAQASEDTKKDGEPAEPSGVFRMDLERVEVLGRDISVIGHKKECLGDNIRAIISSDNLVDTRKKQISFNLNPSKVFVFDFDTEERIF